MISNMNNAELRDYVRQHMKREGVTQKELAARLDISQGAVSQVLTGASAVPKSFTDLLDALGLELVVQPKAK